MKQLINLHSKLLSPRNHLKIWFWYLTGPKKPCINHLLVLLLFLDLLLLDIEQIFPLMKSLWNQAFHKNIGHMKSVDLENYWVITVLYKPLSSYVFLVLHIETHLNRIGNQGKNKIRDFLFHFEWRVKEKVLILLCQELSTVIKKSFVIFLILFAISDPEKILNHLMYLVVI